MALKDLVSSAVTAAYAASWTQPRIDETVSYLLAVGAFYVATDATLAVKADMVGVVRAAVPQMALPNTTIAAADNTTLTSLKNLVSAGLVTGLQIHDGETTVHSV